MSSVYFHDLPIYRVTQEAYRKRQEKVVSAFFERSYAGLSIAAKDRREVLERMNQDYYDRHGPWRFNEIVGYVHLYFDGNQVLGAYFETRQKKKVLSRRKVFVWRTHKLAPELDVPRNATNAQVLETILEYVNDCRRELPRRFIDDEWLRTVGPYVDWNALLRSGWRPAR
jgi:hypothetical protein